MSNAFELPHLGKRAICAIAQKPFQLPGGTHWLCHLVPLLLGNRHKDSWEPVSADEFPDCRMVWCRLPNTLTKTSPGELVSIQLESSQKYKPGEARYQATNFQAISLYELIEQDVTDQDFINEQPIRVSFVPTERFYVTNGQDVFGPLRRDDTHESDLTFRCLPALGGRLLQVCSWADF